MFWFSLLLFAMQRQVDASAVHPLLRRLKIINESGENLAVDWVNPKDGKPQPFRQSHNGATLALDSYVNHTFIIRSKPDANETSTCSSEESSSENQQECRVVSMFSVSAVQAIQMVHIKEGLEVIYTEDILPKLPNPVASELIFKCRIKSDTAVERREPIKKVMKELLHCLEMETSAAIERQTEELGFQSELRVKLSAMAENFTCSDPSMETTTPKETRTWTHKGVSREVGILHDRPSSQIHIIHNFISREECDAIEQAAKPTLHRGTVADGKGGSRLSDNRKAWQAGIKVKWDEEAMGDPIAAVNRRLFDYANHVTGFNMSVDGQEDLMSIQYFGNGTDDPRPDRYMPHCDGDCDGMPHKLGGRVATMVMYCDVPELGGGTNFQNSNVFVKATPYAAAFFSYMNPSSNLHETGFTSHSGCPVMLGTKRIAVQWMRVGVDTKNPWDSFDTNTIRKSAYEEYDLEESDDEKNLGSDDDDFNWDFDDDDDDDDEDEDWSEDEEISEPGDED